MFIFHMCSLLFSVVAMSLDLNQLNASVWLSGAAYCDKDSYKTMKLAGPAEGFIYKDTLHDIKTDLQGYVGTLESTKSIYVVLRGSSSVMNWLDDFEVRLVPYESYPECNCNVHNGFYKSALSITTKTVDVIKVLKKLYPLYNIVVTGHSYGASCAQLLAMELERNGIETQLYTYGQPRVGDSRYAGFVNTVIDEYWRITHDKDIVPHVPPSIGLGYYHSCREIFENSSGKLKECSISNCEDVSCSDQYSLSQTNITDHSYYLGHYLSCNESITSTHFYQSNQ